jgi:hypothetical protein
VVYYYSAFSYDQDMRGNGAMTLPPPAPVTEASATPGNTYNVIRWTNPTSETYWGTVLVSRGDRFPTGPMDGAVLSNQTWPKGSQSSLTHTGLSNGATCYYALFAHNGGSAYSTGVTVSAVPYGPADLDRDGDIDQEDFGRFQACLSGPAKPQNDPACQDAKLDADSDVDLNDLGIFQRCMSGANHPADPNCAN